MCASCAMLERGRWWGLIPNSEPVFARARSLHCAACVHLNDDVTWAHLSVHFNLTERHLKTLALRHPCIGPAARITALCTMTRAPQVSVDFLFFDFHLPPCAPPPNRSERLLHTPKFLGIVPQLACFPILSPTVPTPLFCSLFACRSSCETRTLPLFSSFFSTLSSLSPLSSLFSFLSSLPFSVFFLYLCCFSYLVTYLSVRNVLPQLSLLSRSLVLLASAVSSVLCVPRFLQSQCPLPFLPHALLWRCQLRLSPRRCARWRPCCGCIIGLGSSCLSATRTGRNELFVCASACVPKQRIANRAPDSHSGHHMQKESRMPCLDVSLRPGTISPLREQERQRLWCYTSQLVPRLGTCARSGWWQATRERKKS